MNSPTTMTHFVNGNPLEGPFTKCVIVVGEGHIIVSYDVNTRGRVSALKIVEATPAEFDDMRRLVQREMRTRVFRPRFEDAEPVESTNEVFTHTFYYRQEDLEELREEAAAEAGAS